MLGRVLSVLGAPVGSHRKGLLSLPPYLGSVSKEYKQSFARIVILNRYRKKTDEGVRLAVPHYSRILRTSLFKFFEDIGGENVKINEEDLILNHSLIERLANSGTKMEKAALCSLMR